MRGQKEAKIGENLKVFVFVIVVYILSEIHFGTRVQMNPPVGGLGSM
jgi:hypothetical protein